MFELLPHPEHPPSAARSISVQLGRAGSGYRFHYFLVGDMSRIVVPPRIPKAGRADELWKTTCFEAFVKGDGDGYSEFNFSPSGEWASYRFDGYREGRRDVPASVDIHCDRLDNLLAVDARFNADFARSTRLSLSAVVDEVDGTKSYWALAHPDGKPDFHHDACFALRLADIA